MSTSTGQSAAQTSNATKAAASGQPSVLTLYIPAVAAGLYLNRLSAIHTQADLMLSMTITPPPTQSTGYLGLLTGSLDDFQNYALHEHSGWLLGMAHDICDPLLQRGTLRRWDIQADQFVPVSDTDVLQADAYVYALPPGVVVSLSKISERHNKSVTSASGSASTMRGRVISRDLICWISQGQRPLTNSHIVPKRTGDVVALFILSQFCPGTVATGVFDTIFGLTLSDANDKLFDAYELGFRYVSPNVYDCHVFVTCPPGSVETIYGRLPSTAGLPPLHTRRVSAPRPTATDLPPAGLFRWHYMQCVLKHFAHEDYRARPNIIAPSISIKIHDENDTDSDSDGPADWPSAAWDLGRLAYAQEQEEKARQEAVANWISAQ